jgi:N-acetylmuramoyl-L-alanine amidase
MRWSRQALGRADFWRFVASMSLLCPILLSGQAAPPVAPSGDLANSAQTEPTKPSVQPVAPPPQPLQVMIDAAHGGTESGAILNPALLEKELTLLIAQRLRQELNSRGVQCHLLREGDATLSTDRRTAMVNAAQPLLYVSIHVTSQGNGMKVYSAMLPAGGEDRGPFIDWQTAQSASLERSRWAQQQLVAAIQKMGFPIRSLTAQLRPLNNVTVPAVAVEIAPTTGQVLQLASTGYQQMIAAALANSIVPVVPSLRVKGGGAP